MSEFDAPMKLPSDDAESREAAPEGEGGALPGLSAEPDATPNIGHSVPLSDDDLEPPEPAFLIRENAFGPGAHSVTFTNGTPVGQWLAYKHPLWKQEHVLKNLLEMGLPPDHAAAFARRRALRDHETESLAAVIGPDSLWAEFVKLEAERAKRLEPLRAAFIAAQKKKK